MFCLRLACVMMWVISSNRVRCLDLQREFQRHSKMVSGFPCGRPQPRIFLLENLVDPLEWKSKYEPAMRNILPWYTVLHRCDSAGCCSIKGARCLPKNVVDVQLTFSNVTTSAVYFQIPAKNHTTCGCFSSDTVDSIK